MSERWLHTGHLDVPDGPPERGPIVWLVNDGGHDGYQKAERFGRIVKLTTGSVNPFALDRMAQALAPQLALAQEDDYICISGLPILNGLVMVMWFLRFRTANILQWAAKREDYQLLTLSVDNLNRMWPV